MLGKLNLTRNKRPESCWCPKDKSTAFKEKNSLKPRFYVETSKTPPPVPIIIKPFKKHSNIIKIKDSLSRLKPKETSYRGSNICNWYTRRRALSELKKDQKRRQELYEKAKINKEHREREIELLEQLKKQQVIDSLPLTSSTPKIKIATVEPKTQKQKKRKEPKVKSTNTRTKKANYVVRQKHKDPLCVRCSNWWYRACCKFFCCLSCVLIVSFVIIFVIPMSVF